MYQIILVKTNGELEEIKIDKIDDTNKLVLKKLYTFSLHQEGASYIELYGNTEPYDTQPINTYKFPPPMDTKTIYGDCILVEKNLCGQPSPKNLNNLTIRNWNSRLSNFGSDASF